MRGLKINLVVTTCRRCGKKVTTNTGSLYGITDKQGLDRICKDCITPEEYKKILDLQGSAVIKSLIK